MIGSLREALECDGFFVHASFLTEPEVTAARECHDRLRADGVRTSAQVLYTHAPPPGPPEPFDRLMTQWLNPHRRPGPSGTSTLAYALGERVRKLGFDVRMFQDALLSKSTSHACFPWHQDEPFWPFDAAEGLVIWCALDPVEHTNGGLELARGSHRLGRGPSIDLHTGHAQPGSLAQGLPIPSLTGDCPALQPGDAVLFCPRTWHRSGRNTNGASRRAWSSSWVPANAVVQPRLAPRHPLARAELAAGRPR